MKFWPYFLFPPHRNCVEFGGVDIREDLLRGCYFHENRRTEIRTVRRSITDFCIYFSLFFLTDLGEIGSQTSTQTAFELLWSFVKITAGRKG